MKTVSLETAKQLKEAGYPQESYFWWEKWIGEKEGYSLMHYKGIEEWHVDDKARMFAAPTAEEILEKLPVDIKVRKKLYNLEILKEVDGYFINYSSYSNGNYEIVENEKDETLVEAAAKMWHYLKKEGLI